MKKKHDLLMPKFIVENNGGWDRYSVEDLFEISLPKSVILNSIVLGGTYFLWKNQSLVLSISIANPANPPGTAPDYLCDLVFRALHESSKDCLERELENDDEWLSHSVYETLGNSAEQILCLERLIDRHTLYLSHYFYFGGCWELWHSIVGEDPREETSYLSIADKIAKSVLFTCPPDKLRESIYME